MTHTGMTEQQIIFERDIKMNRKDQMHAIFNLQR